MCRQYYRHCRDCHEYFPLPEPDMREPCEAFKQARAIKPHLKKCPETEIQIPRGLSGHGRKVCEPCGKKNRNKQRQRENALKRERRANLKRNKMTAGIGVGNVVWTAPNTLLRASVVDAQTMALHSPQPLRLNTFDVKSMTQAIQHGLNGSRSTATMAQNHVNASQHKGGMCSWSHQVSAATTSNTLQPEENGPKSIAAETRDDANLHHQYRSEPQHLPIAKLDVPLYQQKQRQPIGLGISIANDVKWGQSPTEPCSFNEWTSVFRMQLNEWSTVFEENDAHGNAKEI